MGWMKVDAEDVEEGKDCCAGKSQYQRKVDNRMEDK